MAQHNDAMTAELPDIKKIETTARVGEDRHPAVVVWFENDSALRYVWSEERDEIREQTYLDGVVHDEFGVGGSRDELAAYALESIAEYIGSYQDDPEACQKDWSHIYEMLVAQPMKR